MRNIKIFLASSKELEIERRQFEIEIYRKCKILINKGVFLHLDIWEDLSARMSIAGSQDKYNKKVREADIFILLAYTKIGMYTEEEFETAFGEFQINKKPFVFTYFKEVEKDLKDNSLESFKIKLRDLKHFYCNFKDHNDLWNQFNKELERLSQEDFKTNKFINEEIENNGRVYNQKAEKIFNIDKIDNFNA